MCRNLNDKEKEVLLGIYLNITNESDFNNLVNKIIEEHKSMFTENLDTSMFNKTIRLVLSQILGLDNCNELEFTLMKSRYYQYNEGHPSLNYNESKCPKTTIEIIEDLFDVGDITVDTDDGFVTFDFSGDSEITVDEFEVLISEYLEFYGEYYVMDIDSSEYNYYNRCGGIRFETDLPNDVYQIIKMIETDEVKESINNLIESEDILIEIERGNLILLYSDKYGLCIDVLEKLINDYLGLCGDYKIINIDQKDTETDFEITTNFPYELYKSLKIK